MFFCLCSPLLPVDPERSHGSLEFWEMSGPRLPQHVTSEETSDNSSFWQGSSLVEMTKHGVSSIGLQCFFCPFQPLHSVHPGWRSVHLLLWCCVPVMPSNGNWTTSWKIADNSFSVMMSRAAFLVYKCLSAKSWICESKKEQRSKTF